MRGNQFDLLFVRLHIKGLMPARAFGWQAGGATSFGALFHLRNIKHTRSIVESPLVPA